MEVDVSRRMNGNLVLRVSTVHLIARGLGADRDRHVALSGSLSCPETARLHSCRWWQPCTGTAREDIEMEVRGVECKRDEHVFLLTRYLWVGV